ncbi:ABC transporter permease [Lentibacillus sediminis]|uniref:ABC transporter permease n=1 Tax=Lentibacillus sediminis TaxID=1940529 RepID=UPI000C1C16AB|nr:ABC transporter permease [Lentibacillus sediminis]
MRSFIKKDLLIFWRDRKELMTVLLLPIVLVVVLNFAFSGLLGNDEESGMDLQLAVVNQDDETEAMADLQEKLTREASLGESEAAALVEQASHADPVQMLFDFLDSEDVTEIVTVHQLEEDETIEKAQAGEMDGILVIPNGFAADSLYAAFTGESPATSLVFKMENETMNTSALFQIINGFMEQMNFQFALQAAGSEPDAEVMLPEGGFEEVEAVESHSFSLTQYFTVAMGALFSLFIAATVATKTGEEIRQQVFNRILLTNSHSVLFLIGKVVSTFFLAWFQMMFVFMFSQAVLDAFPDRSITFWLGTIGIVTLLSLSIAGLGAVFTAISLRVTNIDAANGIFFLVIILFGVIGGNFVPVYVMPDWLQQIGEWTPNGRALVMLTEWIQFEELSSIIMPSMLLIGFFLLCIVIGLILFPKRGKAS